MAGNIALGALPGVFPAKREHVTAVATPIRSDVGKRLETMRNTMVDLLLVSLLKREKLEEGGTTIGKYH
jgi:hypothetical protein